jgi:hypothetical protein
MTVPPVPQVRFSLNNYKDYTQVKEAVFYYPEGRDIGIGDDNVRIEIGDQEAYVDIDQFIATLELFKKAREIQKATENS